MLLANMSSESVRAFIPLAAVMRSGSILIPMKHLQLSRRSINLLK